MSDKLCRLALIVMFALAFVQIINFFNQKPTIIETKLEHLNPSLLTHQVDDWAPEITDKPTITYYYKGDRYSKDMKFDPKLIDPLHQDTSLSCGPKFDWDVNATPGANNVYGDLLWHKTNPKMILESGCLKCSHGRQSSYDSPSGVASLFTSKYDNDMAIGPIDKN